MANKIKNEFIYPVEASSSVTESTKSVVAKIPRSDTEKWINEYEFENEVEVPELNYPVSETVLDRAIKHNRRIAVRPGRLKFLQYLESTMPEVIDEAMKAYKKQKLDTLHAKDKKDPAAAAARARKYVVNNRELINARRREKRKKAKTTEPSNEKKPITNDTDRITVTF